MFTKCLIVGVGGFVGANARYLLGNWAKDRWGSDFPYGTFLINITGCFVIGVFSTLLLRYAWNDTWRLLIAVGFVGAYTTFSTFEYDSLNLIAQGAWGKALFNLLGSVILGFFAAYLGVMLVRLLFGNAPTPH